MKKPDYKGFVLHIREWERIGISYGMKELRELALKYDCPIINTRALTSDELIKVKKEWMDHISVGADFNIDDIIVIVGGIIAICAIVFVVYISSMGIR